MKQIQNYRSFEGEQVFFEFESSFLKGSTKFGIYLPPKALKGEKCAALFYLAGLTCTEETFAIKAHAQRLAAELNLILITPDTSPRGENVPTGDSWDLGQGAGFYIDATNSPWQNQYKMESFFTDELYNLVLEKFPIEQTKIGISGHSMGGHGALTLAWKYPEKFKSVSAFSPICAPILCPWGIKAFSNYLGSNQTDWALHDATKLIEKKGRIFKNVLIDQGKNDQFYDQLNPHLLIKVCSEADQPLILREHEGYDHGYYFIQTFIDDHLKFHYEQLNSIEGF